MVVVAGSTPHLSMCPPCAGRGAACVGGEDEALRGGRAPKTDVRSAMGLFLLPFLPASSRTAAAARHEPIATQH